MALKQLNEEQIRDWTLEQKDQWWFKNVWKGDMPQLTIRSAFTGMILGGVLSLTNLYIGAKTGWSLGVGITSVILAFSLFKVLSSLRLSSEFTLLENNCMQSIATAAGYMTAPMTSSLAAYMMITGEVIPIYLAMAWSMSLATLGVLFAFPLKRRFINDEQHPFPEGRAAGVVMDSLHESNARDGIVKGMLLAVSGAIAAIITLCSEGASVLEKLKLSVLQLPHFLDAWIYKFCAPRLGSLDPRQLGIGVAPEIAMFGAGGLMGIKIGVSLMVGGIINYFILAPYIIDTYDNHIKQHTDPIVNKKVFMDLESGKKVVEDDKTGEFIFKQDYRTPEQLKEEAEKAKKEAAASKKAKKPEDANGNGNEAAVAGVTLAAASAPDKSDSKGGDTVSPAKKEKPEKPKPGNVVKFYGFKAITFWTLWGGVAMMTAASLFAFFSKPQILISSFKGLFNRKKEASENEISREMKKIELPMIVFCIGIPIMGTVVVLLANYIFGVKYWQGAIAIPLIFIFTLIAVNSTALTGITPTGALAKLTQLTYAGIAPGNIHTNIASAAITGEVAGHASNLLMDIKPGYMLGGKPRQQAIGHVLGIFAGSLCAVPVFYLVFLKGNPMGLVSEQYPMPSAVIWKSVAELLTEGIKNLPVTARWSVLAGVAIGLLCEILKLVTKGRFWLSGVGMGLAMVIPFPTCLSMFSGAFFFWIIGVIWRNPESWVCRIVVKNTEAVCAGLIAGGALTGILIAILENLVF